MCNNFSISGRLVCFFRGDIGEGSVNDRRSNADGRQRKDHCDIGVIGSNHGASRDAPRQHRWDRKKWRKALRVCPQLASFYSCGPCFAGANKPNPSTPDTAASCCPGSGTQEGYQGLHGNGGGENCLNGADAKYDCNTYRAFGGGGPQTYNVLADMFCSYTDGSAKKIYPHDIVVIQDNGGGQCGWTAFQVTCNP